MFTQCVVVFATLFIVATLSDITIHQEGHQHECINLSCPKGAFNDIDHPLIKENSKEQKCTICTQCTNFGYSVCAQPLSKALRFRRELDEDHCACANFVPETCKISQISSANKKDPNNRIFKICYLSTLRTPPKVYGLNQEKDVIVTIEQFWLEPYWRDFELNNLTLFYKFEVKSPEHCDEIGKVTTINDSSTPLHICTSSLPIEMNGENIPTDTSEAGKKSYDPTDNDDQYEDENAPPEVAFGRDVFVGAKFVDIWYTVTVKRPHQLSFGERPFHDVTTVISSESLKHNLEPEVFGNGMGANNDASDDNDDKKVSMSKETKAGHDSVSKVNIQTEKDDDEDDEEEDKEDPIPSDNPGITDDSDEETEEGDDADKDDKTEKDEDDKGEGEDEDVEETEETEETEATEEPEEADKDDEEETDKSEKETNASDEEVEDEETTTIAVGEETTEAPTEESQESDETTTILDDDMASVNETQSFFEQHFSNWPTMRVVFVLVAIASIILIAAACCYRYRGCCCYSDQQKVVTKTSNGYEYHVTGQQTGQEMVGPPETQKLTQ